MTLRRIDRDLLPDVEDLNGNPAEGLLYDYGENAAPATTTSNIPTYVNHLSHSVRGGESLPAGDYRIAWQVICQHSSTSTDLGVNVQLQPGSQPITNEPLREEPTDTAVTQSNYRSGFRVITWAGGPMTVEIQFARSGPPGIAQLKFSACEVWRVN